MLSDLHWVGKQDGQLAAAGVTAVYVGNNQVARAWFGQDLVGGKVISSGEFRGALDRKHLEKTDGFQVHIDINGIAQMRTLLPEASISGQAGISNYIPHFTVGCNYLSLQELPASGNKVHKCHLDGSWKWHITDVQFVLITEYRILGTSIISESRLRYWKCWKYKTVWYSEKIS